MLDSALFHALTDRALDRRSQEGQAGSDPLSGRVAAAIAVLRAFGAWGTPRLRTAELGMPEFVTVAELPGTCVGVTLAWTLAGSPWAPPWPWGLRLPWGHSRRWSWSSWGPSGLESRED